MRPHSAVIFSLSPELKKMAFKVILFVSLCIAQGFALKPSGGFPGQRQCKDSVSGGATVISSEYEEAVNEMDEVMEDYLIRGKGNEDVIIACFRQQKDNYMRVGQQITGILRQAYDEMAGELGDKYEKYAEKARVPLKTIGETMKTLPEKMWFYMKDKNFGEAFEVMKESRKTVRENSKVLNEIIVEMAEEAPEAAKRAREIGREIHTTARTGCKTMREEFMKCVKEEKPQNFIGNDE